MILILFDHIIPSNHHHHQIIFHFLDIPPPTTPSTNSTCHTVSGPDPISECSFPFIFAFITWTGCTTFADIGGPWCVTQTNEAGYPISNVDNTFTNWGYCHASCPIDQGLTFCNRMIWNEISPLLFEP